jgi:hypothetical protein
MSSRRLVKVWTPTYVAEAGEFSYIWEEMGHRSAGIRLYNARVKYNDGHEEYLHVLDIILRPDSGIYWGYVEVPDDAEN